MRMNVSLVDQTALLAFWLIFTRWMAIVIQIPLFDNTVIPPMLKVLITIIISYAFFPYLSGEVMKDINYIGEEHFWFLTCFYGVIGLAIGFLVKAILDIFISAGSIITQQMGFDAIRYFDPQSGQEMGPVEKLIHWTIVVMVISSGALIPMFKGIYSSFFSIHFYDLGKMAHATEFFVTFFKSVFLSGLMLASPLVVINMLITAILGIIARTVPQMNIIMVSFIINIGLGLLVFATSSNEFFQVAFSIYSKKLGEWFQFIS